MPAWPNNQPTPERKHKKVSRSENGTGDFFISTLGGYDRMLERGGENVKYFI
jgi:hypothetical protein